MNVTGDFEIIRASLLVGDIRDVMRKVRSAKKHADSRFSESSRKKYASYSSFLDILSEVLSGKNDISVLRSAMKKGEFISLLKVPDAEKYTETFLFFLEYAIDRYNIRYPEYDEKRCNDA